MKSEYRSTFFRRFTGLLIMAGLSAVTSWSQCHVKGRVIGRNLDAVAGAVVRLYNSDSVLVKAIETDSQGFFDIEVPSPGTYGMNIVSNGYSPLVKKRLALRKGVLDLTDIDMCGRIKIDDGTGKISFEESDSSRYGSLLRLWRQENNRKKRHKECQCHSGSATERESINIEGHS